MHGFVNNVQINLMTTMSAEEEQSEGNRKNMDWYICVYCKKNFPSKTECSNHRRKEHHKPIRIIMHRVKSPILIILDEDEETEESGKQQQQKQQNQIHDSESQTQADEKFGQLLRSEVTSTQILRRGESVAGESVKESFDQGQSFSLSHPVKPPLENNDQNQGQGQGQHKNSEKRGQIIREKDPEQSEPHQTPESGEIVQQAPDNEGRVLRPRRCKERKFGESIVLTNSSTPGGHVEENGQQLYEQGSSPATSTPTCSRGKKRPRKKLKTPKRKKRDTMFVIPGHIQVKEVGEERKIVFECTVCKTSFGNKYHVGYHKFCPDPSSRPLTCGECGVKFVYQSHLNNHLLVHTGEKPYSCRLCPEKYSSRNNLLDHIVGHMGKRPCGGQRNNNNNNLGRKPKDDVNMNVDAIRNNTTVKNQGVQSLPNTLQENHEDNNHQTKN